MIHLTLQILCVRYMNILNIVWNSVYYKKEDVEIGILSCFVVIVVIAIVFIFIFIVILVVVVVVIVTIIIHFPYFIANKLVLKRIWVSVNKYFLITVLPKTF